MEFKVGDKVVCIKDRNSYGNVYVITNNIYTILEILNSTILVNCEKGYNIDAATYRRFANKDDYHVYFHMFADHFISLKESRKLKLKKLSTNENW